eukprot:jgi/Astpho2/9931/Aster-x1618
MPTITWQDIKAKGRGRGRARDEGLGSGRAADGFEGVVARLQADHDDAADGAQMLQQLQALERQMEQQQRSEQALMELQRRKQGEIQRRRSASAGQAPGQPTGAQATHPAPGAGSKRQAGQPAEDFVDLCNSGSDSDSGCAGSPQPSSHRSKRARLSPEAVAAAEEQSQQAALDAAATLPARKAAALTAASARACGGTKHVQGSSVAEQVRQHKAGAGAAQVAASGPGWSMGICDGTVSAGSWGARGAAGTAGSRSQGPSGVNPFTAPAQYVPAGGWESVVDVDLYTDMYVDVLDIGMTRHRASACLDTGNGGCTLIQSSLAHVLGLCDQFGNPLESNSRSVTVRGVVAGASEHVKTCTVTYEVKGKRMTVRAGLTSAKLGCDLLISCAEIRRLVRSRARRSPSPVGVRAMSLAAAFVAQCGIALPLLLWGAGVLE